MDASLNRTAEESLASDQTDSNDKSVNSGSSRSNATASKASKKAAPAAKSDETSKPQRVTRQSLSSQSSVGKEAPPAPTPAPTTTTTTTAAATTTGTLSRKRKLSKPGESETAAGLEEKKIKAEKLQELEEAAAQAPPQPEPSAEAASHAPAKRKASVRAKESMAKVEAKPPAPTTTSKSPAKAAANAPPAADKSKKKSVGGAAKKEPEAVAASTAAQVKQEVMKAPAEVPAAAAAIAAIKNLKRSHKKGAAAAARAAEAKLNLSNCDVDENTRDCFSDSATSTDKAASKRKSLSGGGVGANAGKKGGKHPSESDTVDELSSRDDSSASALHFSKKGSTSNFLNEAKNTTNSLLEEGDSQSQSQSQSQEETKNELGDLSQSAEPKKRKKRRGSIFDLEHAHKANLPASDLFVYKWPQEDSNAESYILQEQVSEFLHVKSFKRKYPDIFRRFIDIAEREYLKENNVVTEVQCDLGLTALKLSDCLDLMAEEYPEKYNELNNFLIEKRRKMLAAAAALQSSQILAKRKAELQMMRANRAAMSESDRQKENLRKAMFSASAFNAQLQREKKEERNAFFDLQTFRIQRPVHDVKMYKTSPDAYEKGKKLYENKLGLYPVTLLPGQYQHYYKVYQCEELRFLPLNTVLDDPPAAPSFLYQDWQPSADDLKLLKEHQAAKSNDDAEIEHQHQLIGRSQSSSSVPAQVNGPVSRAPSVPSTPVAAATAAAVHHQTPQSTSQSQSRILPAGIKIVPATPTSAPTLKLCYLCHKPGQVSQSQDAMISCSSCPRSSHPACLELNASLVNWPCIRQYEWQCMECKKCSTCNQPHDEDKMLFCDRCDRGFHTYCVGVSSVPSGSWLCKPCGLTVGNLSISSDGSPSKTRGRGRPPGSLNKPKDPSSPKKSSKSGKPKKLNMIFDELRTANRIDVDYDNDNTSFDDDEETMDNE